MNEFILFFGGPSGERKVSVASAQFVAQAAPKCKCWFWSIEGNVFQINRDELLNHTNPFEIDFKPSVFEDLGPLDSALGQVGAEEVLFLAVHGGDGENGTLQEILERNHVAFTASGSRASHRAFDKSIAKEIVFQHGGQVPRGIMARGDHKGDARIRIEELMELVGQVVVKPIADGSSIGVHFVFDHDSLDAALRELQNNPNAPYLVEERILGRELTVGVLDTTEGPKALPCSEVCLNEGREFDYAGKYLGDGVLEITPAEINWQEAQKAQELACMAHVALGCTGYSRTDIMLTPQQDVIFIETNTLPGLSSASFILV